MTVFEISIGTNKNSEYLNSYCPTCLETPCKFSILSFLYIYSYQNDLIFWRIPILFRQEEINLFVSLQLFEGLKVYRGVDGKIRTFRPDLNMQRMNSSALGSGLPTFDGMELIKCLRRLVQVDQEWVPHGEGSSLYIRPTLIGIDVSTNFTIMNKISLEFKISWRVIYLIPDI